MGTSYRSITPESRSIYGSGTVQRLHLFTVCSPLSVQECAHLSRTIVLDFTLLLSGGYPDYYQFVEYDVVDNIFTDHGQYYLSSPIGNSNGEFGYNNHYTQLNEYMLYTKRTHSDNLEYIHVYDLRTVIHKIISSL